MGWEWRSFFHGDLRGNFENHIKSTMPNLLNRYPEAEAEERYDVYACVDEGVGFKVRGDEDSDVLEVKTRLQRQNLGAEQWQKELLPRERNKTGMLNSSLSDDVKGLLEQEGRQITGISEVKLHKSRLVYKGTRVPDEKYKGVSVECTLIETADGEAFTSICVEHHKNTDKIYSLLTELKLSDFERDRLIVSRQAEQSEHNKTCPHKLEYSILNNNQFLSIQDLSRPTGHQRRRPNERRRLPPRHGEHVFAEAPYKACACIDLVRWAALVLDKFYLNIITQSGGTLEPGRWDVRWSHAVDELVDSADKINPGVSVRC
eukprot:663879-Hanusia_phi.AAC.2